MYIREFSGGIKLKIIKHEAVGDKEVLEEFEKEGRTLNHSAWFQKMVDEVDIKGPKVVNDKAGKMLNLQFVEIMQSWYERFLKDADLWLEKKVAKAVLRTSKTRCEIKSTVYNFSSKEIDQKLLRILNLGGNFVLHNDSLDEEDAHSKIERELYNYLTSYRKYIQRESAINQYFLTDWLTEAIQTSEDDEHKEFYESMKSFKELKVSRRRYTVDENPNFKELDDNGVVVIDCDKNCGIAIMDVNEIVEADAKMVNELGGSRCEGQTENDVKKAIIKTINNFEQNLSNEQRKYLNVYYPGRREALEDSVLPYMKLKAKIHKLTEDQLENKEIKLLKYRPVIDSSRTPFQHYSNALRNYISDLISRLEKKFFPESSPMVKNGIQVARYLKSLENLKTEGTFIAIADLSSAYTYIFVGNLKYAMKYAARVLGITECKDKMFQEMASLILENSYVETSGGIHKLGPCLPMGLGISGEAMDLVNLVSELGLFGKEAPSELSKCSQIFPEWGISDETKLMKSVIKYFRYRDDTFTFANLNGERTPKETIMALGSAFLTSLDMNFNLSHLVGSFLDCFFYKRISGTGFVTLVRRKGNFPVTFQHANSNYGDGIIRSIINGEVLRYNRICSTSKLTEMNNTCLINELESRGYIRDYILQQINARKEGIESDYDEDFEKISKKSTPEGLVYGTKTQYDSTWLTHVALKKLLRDKLMPSVKLPMTVPGTRLKTKYYTKARYLKMSKKYIDNKTSE